VSGYRTVRQRTGKGWTTVREPVYSTRQVFAGWDYREVRTPRTVTEQVFVGWDYREVKTERKVTKQVFDGWDYREKRVPKMVKKQVQVGTEVKWVLEKVPPPPPPAYDPAESVQQAWGLVWDFLRGENDQIRIFGPESSLTQDIRYDPGMTAFHQAWAEAGYPVSWKWEHYADAPRYPAEKCPTNIEELKEKLPEMAPDIIRGSGVYAREHLWELVLATVLAPFGLPKTPESPIDAVGGTIGSLDEIKVFDAGNGMVRIEVHNSMDSGSGTRVPGTECTLQKPEAGSALEMKFWWLEPMPGR
ncbi:MAG: hypothetical protein QME83_19050, partial [Thermodesulfobacteriota bacterium]|nr:hypothetical protein [Thermodesulfobacteriota bacterium]